MADALPDPIPPLLTGPQVCGLFHIGSSTLQAWRERGDIEAVPLPNGWRYASTQPLIARALAAIGRLPVPTP